MNATPANSPEALAVVEAAREVIRVHRELAFSPGVAGRKLEDRVEEFDERFPQADGDEAA